MMSYLDSNTKRINKNILLTDSESNKCNSKIYDIHTYFNVQ